MTTPAEVIAEYDRRVRANMTPEWDTIRAVAECDEGYMGAYGEAIDTAEDMGVEWGNLVEGEGWEQQFSDAFAEYQRTLRAEVASRSGE